MNVNQIAPDFNSEEFACNCGCGEDRMNTWFIKRLQAARTIADLPFAILSGARCPDHNASVGGGDKSAHVPEFMPDKRGHGVDIRYGSSREAYIIVTALLSVGFTRIGFNDGGIHVDDAEKFEFKDEEVMWGYYNNE